MLAATAAIAGQGLGEEVALVTDGRLAPRSASASATSPPKRSQTYRPGRRGRRDVLDVDQRTIDLLVPDAEIEARHARWTSMKPRYETGALAKYAKLVGSASEGAVCR